MSKKQIFIQNLNLLLLYNLNLLLKSFCSSNSARHERWSTDIFRHLQSFVIIILMGKSRRDLMYCCIAVFLVVCYCQTVEVTRQ